MNLEPIHNCVLVRKCVNDHIRNQDGSVMLYRPAENYEHTNWAEILKIGPRCVIITKNMIGSLVQCPEYVNGMRFVGDDCWIIRETNLIRKELAGVAMTP